MAKTDIKGAFRLVPIRPEDHSLLGFIFEDSYYYDLVLTMGAGSSCRIFQRIANAINWVARNKLHITRSLQYTDDTFLVEPTEEICRKKLELFKKMYYHIGFIIAEEKTEGPLTCLTFLGVELDADLRCARMPVDKLRKCSNLISVLLQNRYTTLHELQKVLGTLNFATTVIQPGRCFLRRLINLTAGNNSPSCRITLNCWAKWDPRLWMRFLSDFNGVSFFRDRRFVSISSTLQLCTDAATTCGFGAIFKNEWFFGKWGRVSKSRDIAWMELYAVVAAVCVWGKRLACKSVHFLCDNESVVGIINKQSTRQTSLMSLVRVLVMVCLRNNILFRAKHIPGVTNTLPDLLSRSQIQQFYEQAVLLRWDVDPSPVNIPDHYTPERISSEYGAYKL